MSQQPIMTALLDAISRAYVHHFFRTDTVTMHPADAARLAAEVVVTTTAPGFGRFAIANVVEDPGITPGEALLGDFTSYIRQPQVRVPLPSAILSPGIVTDLDGLPVVDRPTPVMPPPKAPEPSRWNARCGCGALGYLGFREFECSAAPCPIARPQ